MGDFAAGFFSGAGDKFGESMEERVRVNQQAQQFADTMKMDQKRFDEEVKNSESNRSFTAVQMQSLLDELERRKLDDPFRRGILGEDFRGKQIRNEIDRAAVPYAPRSAELDIRGKEEAIRTSKAQRKQFKSAEDARKFQQNMEREKFDFTKLQSILSNSRDDKQLALAAQLQTFNENKFEFDKEMAGLGRLDKANEFAAQMDSVISQRFMEHAAPLINVEMGKFSAGEISREELAAETVRIVEDTQKLIDMSKPSRKGGAPSFSPELTGETGSVPVPPRRVGSRKNADGSESTHLFASTEADGRYYAYPTLFQKPNGDWYELEPRSAFEEAMRKGEALEFRSQEQADRYAEGAWKSPSKPKIDLAPFNKRSAVEATGKQNAKPVDVASNPQSQEFYWNANPGQLYVIHPGTNQAVKLNVFATTFQDAMKTLKAATENMPKTASAQDMQEAVNKYQAAYNDRKKNEDWLRRMGSPFLPSSGVPNTPIR